MHRVKRIVKRLLRPFAKPLLNRLAAQQQQIDQFTHLLPVLLNAIATQNATAREFERWRAAFAGKLDDFAGKLDDFAGNLHDVAGNLDDFAGKLDDHDARLITLADTMSYVDRRGEFIRREVMYEARYGAGTRGVEKVVPRVGDLEKVQQRGALRLNLGSGHVPRDGFVNVDARDMDGVDVVADVRNLPFEPGTIDEIHSSHLVEHFPVEELRRVLIPHWFELLRPGGRLVAVTPDAETMIKEAAAGRMPFEDLERVTFGDQEYDGDFHFAMFTPDSFAGLLAEAGFTAVEIVERGRRNGLCYEFEIKSERPSDQAETSPASPSSE